MYSNIIIDRKTGGVSALLCAGWRRRTVCIGYDYKNQTLQHWLLLMVDRLKALGYGSHSHY